MKKVIFMFAIVATMLSSCIEASKSSTTTDSTTVDSIVIDSVIVDSVK